MVDNRMKKNIEVDPRGIHAVADEDQNGVKAIPAVIVTKGANGFTYGGAPVGNVDNRMDKAVESDTAGYAQIVDEDVNGTKAIPLVIVTKNAQGVFVYDSIGSGGGTSEVRIWRTGTTVPANTLGADGDAYLQSNGDVYTKNAGAWVKGPNIRGAQGAAGANGAVGAQGPQGVPGPAGATGATGPAGATGPQGPAGANGATGPAGAAGASVLNGTAVPTSTVGKNGDIYIKTDNWEVYARPSGTWASIGNIKGVKGDKGDTGAAGATGATGPAGPAGFGTQAQYNDIIARLTALENA